MRILSVAAMRDAEKEAVIAGTSYEMLMETAGTLAAEAIMQNVKKQNSPKTVLFLCGKGNNAGDAFVAARVMEKAGWQCYILPLCGEEYTPLAKRNLLRLPNTVMQVDAYPDKEFDVVVDAVFGIGFKGSLPDGVKDAFRTARNQDAFSVAFDLPSGLLADTGDVSSGCFCADLTLTFGAHKPALLVFSAKSYVGRVQLIDIGI